MPAPASYLLPIADREPLAWIVAEERTAFAEHRAAEAERLRVGDRLFLYTTRGCFRNPTRDRGRVMGSAEVNAAARRLADPIRSEDRKYPYLVALKIDNLAPLREGVELAPLVPRLSNTFPDERSWGARLRRALVPLDPADRTLIAQGLRKVTVPYPDALVMYRWRRVYGFPVEQRDTAMQDRVVEAWKERR